MTINMLVGCMGSLIVVVDRYMLFEQSI